MKSSRSLYLKKAEKEIRALGETRGVLVLSTGDEELLVKNVGIKNYKAAAVGVTKFSPLHDKVLEEIGKEIKRELKNYSKDPTNTYKYRGELEKLADFRNDHLIREIQQKAPNLHCLASSSFPRNKKVNNAITFRTKNQIRKIQQTMQSTEEENPQFIHSAELKPSFNHSNV